MRRSPDRCTEVELAWVRLGVGDQFRDVVYRHLRIDGQNKRSGRNQGDWGKALDGVVPSIVVQLGTDRERAGGRQHQGIAVGGHGSDRLGGDGAARTGAVLDEKSAEVCRQITCDNTRRHVWRPARAEWHNKFDRSIGVGLRGGQTEPANHCKGEPRKRVQPPNTRSLTCVPVHRSTLPRANIIFLGPVCTMCTENLIRCTECQTRQYL